MSIFKDQWAYDFSCERSLLEICEIFNAFGPWQWHMRENYMFGSYLNARPEDGLHLRIHEYPQAFFRDDLTHGFKSLIEISSDSLFKRREIDALFHRLLRQILATGVREIEPYD